MILAWAKNCLLHYKTKSFIPSKKKKKPLPLNPIVTLSVFNPVPALVTYSTEICQHYFRCQCIFPSHPPSPSPKKKCGHEFYFKFNSLQCNIFHFPYFTRNLVTVTSRPRGHCDYHLFQYNLNTSWLLLPTIQIWLSILLILVSNVGIHYFILALNWNYMPCTTAATWALRFISIVADIEECEVDGRPVTSL